MEAKRQAAPTIDALEGLYRNRYRRFLRLALAVVGRRDLAHEVVQEAFARAIRSRFEFRGDGSVEGWLWAIVLNTARSSARAHDGELPLEGDVPPEVAGNGHAEEWPELRAAVAALPERQRHAVFLRHYADLDYQQIAEALAVDRGTVAATLHAAHQSLRRQMSEVKR